ncbi:MAG: glycine--tRNA ligase [Candidatus Pacebacteria bacterium]|nr:glycine--tRNA ligase [Candidatus Paceibacterota bacterium]
MIKERDLLEKIVSFCKRKGFIFPSSEIYGGFAAVYDLGPYGVELANNLKNQWWKTMVHAREDVVGLDSAIFMSPKIWEASGHVSGFSDPLTECKNCHMRLRVDHLLEEVGILADEKMEEVLINHIFTEHKEKIKCPNCGEKNFTEVKKFNLLVKANLGNFTEDWTKEPVYLRGETCQGIYVNYKNVMNSSRVKIPFGIAQIGKAFRNEITPRQFVFRTREFEQMEMQYFVPPEKEMEEYEKLREARWQYYLSLGIKEKNLRWRRHDNLAFYAKEAYDIEYNYPFGFKELEGIHARGDYDLTQHSKFSDKDLSYVDPVTQKKYMPHVIESSVGVGRTMLAVLCDAFTEESIGDEKRIVMKFPKKIAPIKVAVFPLLGNKPLLIEKAREVYKMLKENFVCEYDDHSNIGKRYRRQDEIGTPYCVTVDFDTAKDNSVTVRDRDTMKQERIQIEELKNYLKKKLEL